MKFAGYLTSNVEEDCLSPWLTAKDVEWDLCYDIGCYLRLGDGHSCVVGHSREDML